MTCCVVLSTSSTICELTMPESLFFTATAEDFKKISGSPVAYWASERIKKIFISLKSLNKYLCITGGMTTGNNEVFLRHWHEVSQNSVGYKMESSLDAKKSQYKWFPYNKGGKYRKWFGNRYYYVNWHNDGLDILSSGRAFPRSREFYFKESLSYSATSSSFFGIRYSDSGFLFDAKGSSCFADTDLLLKSLSFLGSKIASFLLKIVNPTIEF